MCTFTHGNSKNLIYLFVMALVALTACKKSSVPPQVNPSKKDTDVYVVGATMTQNGKYIATYWKNGVAVKLGDSTQDCSASAIAVNGNDVYVAGTLIQNGVNVSGIVWKNGVGTKLPASTTISAISLSGNDIYATGYIPSGSYSSLYLKNGVPVNAAGNTSYLYLSSSALSGNNLYVAGAVGQNDSTLAAYWKNGVKMPLATTRSYAYGIAVNGNDVYVAGAYIGPTYTPTAVYWKNGSPVTLSSQFAQAYAVAVSGTDVYVAGNSISNNAIQVATYWKNGVAHQMTDGTLMSTASAIAVNGNDVYIAGIQDVNSTQDPRPAYWKNGLRVYLPYHSLGYCTGIAVVVH